MNGITVFLDISLSVTWKFSSHAGTIYDPPDIYIQSYRTPIPATSGKSTDKYCLHILEALCTNSCDDCLRYDQSVR
jgi:hypothetical protein